MLNSIHVYIIHSSASWMLEFFTEISDIFEWPHETTSAFSRVFESRERGERRFEGMRKAKKVYSENLMAGKISNKNYA